MQSKTLSQWLAHLETAHPTTIDMGLTRVTQVKNAMDLAPSCPVIIVGGTNGKGSTCAFLSHIYAAAGYKVGTLTSPHLLRFNERIAINSQPVNDEDIVAAFERIEAARGDVSLTYFEFNTLAAVDIFRLHQVDVMILEVGLGGRLDAVNAFDADCAIVTSVDLEHQAYLGDTVEQIAKEKAGIFRAGKPAIFGQDPAPHSLGQHAKNIGAKLLQLNHQFSYLARIDSWQWQANNGSLKIDLPLPALQGAFQLNNAACAVAAVQIMRQQLPVSNEALAQGIAQAQNTARFQIIQRQPEIILDVAHNPHAARALASSLNALPAKRTIAVFGILADKDSDAVINTLQGSIDEWYIAPLDLPRGMTLTALTAKLKKHDIQPIHPYNTIQAAYTAALSQVTENDRIIVFGSFHTVAEVLGSLKDKANASNAHSSEAATQATAQVSSERPENMNPESPNPEHHNNQDVLDEYEHLKNKNRRRLIGAGAITVLAGGLFAAVASNGPKDNIEPKMAQPQQQQHVATEVLRPSGVAPQTASTVPTLTAAEASRPITSSSPSTRVKPVPPLAQDNTSAKTRTPTPAATPAPTLADADSQASLEEQRRLRREEQRKAREQRRLEQQQAREEAARKRAEARQERAEARARAEQERIAKARADEARRKQAQEVVAKAEAERAAKQKAALERAAEQKAAADEARRAERAKLLAQQKAAAERAAQAKTAPKKADDKAANKTVPKQPEKAVASKDNREKRASVQVGAYRDIAAAKAAQQKMKGLNYSSSIEEVVTDKGKVYRLKTGSFPNKSEAEIAAGKLKARGLGGIVLEQK